MADRARRERSVRRWGLAVLVLLVANFVQAPGSAAHAQSDDPMADIAAQFQPFIDQMNAQRQAEWDGNVFGRLLREFQEIPKRWDSIPPPRVAPSGLEAGMVLTAAEEEELARARALLEALLSTPFEGRREFLEARFEARGLDEVDLFLPWQMARIERQTSNERAATILEAWLLLAEVAGRKDILWLAAVEAAQDVGTRRFQVEIVLAFEGWLDFEAPELAEPFKAAIALQSAKFRSAPGHNEENLAAFERARDLAKGAGYPIGLGNALDGEARAMAEEGRYEEALSAFGKAREAYTSAGSELGLCQLGLGEAWVFGRVGRRDEAIRAFRRTREHCSDSGSVDGQAMAWKGEADVYSSMGRDAEAQGAYRQARELYRTIDHRTGEGETWSGEAKVHLRAGETTKALNTFRKAREFFQGVDSPVGEGETWLGEAQALASLGRNEEARAAFREAGDLFERGGSLSAGAGVLAAEAKVLFEMGLVREALDGNRVARYLHQRVGNQAGEAETWTTEGTILFQWGRFEEALAAYGQARELYGAVGNSLGQGNARVGEARAHYQSGRAAEALVAYGKARELHRAAGYPVGVANTWEGEGRVHSLAGRNGDALGAYRRARDIYHSVDNDHGLGNTWQGEAEIRLRQGQWQEAYRAGQKAEELSRAANAPWTTINASRAQALALEQLGQPERVAELAKQILEIFDGLRGTFVTERQRMGFERHVGSVHDLQMGALLELDRRLEALEIAERARSRVFLDLVRSSRDFHRLGLLGRKDPSEELAEIRQQLRGAKTGAEGRTLLDRRRQLERERETSTLDLLTVWPYLETRAALDLAEMQKIVDGVGPVLYFFVAAEKSLAALLRPGQPPVVERIDVGRTELSDSVRDFADLVANPNYGDRYREQGAALSAKLLARFRDRLPTTGPLLVVPHGPLHQIPFDALVDASGRLLGDRFDLTVAPSLSTLGAVLERHRPPSPEDRLYALPAGEGLSRPQAEIQSILDIFDVHYAPGDGPRITDFHSYEFLVRNARHLVVATQGVHEPNSRSGTYLEIEASRGHDGRLSAFEIAAIPVDAELVTLAACDTARGESLLSDERLDLTRAFLIAGAASVLATLWKVPEDQVTSQFLVDFYQAYRKGGPMGKGLRKDEALAEAKRSSRERGAPAQVWAAWVLVGNPR